MPPDTLPLLANLLRNTRAAALGTIRDGSPFVSMVAYVAKPDFSGLLLHLSQLAYHTQDILADNRVSILVTEPDIDHARDPQTLARVTLCGHAFALTPGSELYQQARSAYLRRLPWSEPLFEFRDFMLFEIRMERARLVAGFARTYNLGPEHLAAAALA